MIRRRKLFYGWWMVLAAGMLNFLAGGVFIYGKTVFFNPIRKTFGWNYAATSVAYSLQRFEQGIFGPVAGFLLDRVGARKLMIAGWFVAGLGFILMSRINSLWEFYGSFLVLAIGMSFGAYLVPDATIANWFIKKRSRAMTLVKTGSGIGTVLVPLLVLSITQFGWRQTEVFIGLLLWVLAVPLSSFMRHRPEQYGYLPDGKTRAEIDESTNAPNPGSSSEIAKPDSISSSTSLTVKEAMRTRAFWLIALAFASQHIGTSAVMVHIVPYLESVGIATTIAATAVTGMGLTSLIGRIGFGTLGDFFRKRYLIAIALTFQTAGIFLFSFINMDRAWLIIPFLLIYATGYGATIPLRVPLQADYFGTRHFGSIIGLMLTISMSAAIASPIIAGWIFDITGGYQLAWRLFSLMTLPGIPLMLLAKPPRDKPELEATTPLSDLPSQRIPH
ncbi:MFS transporter [Chloroflexota bacterium]